ncbi:MAG: GspH/FimT family pseudopilin [Candidatus Accumulibacter sp.]|jgi:type IV fimbrial biogenesis protein FimT|nr:GspH/FimT family pseudopilin [Accumulibacter sp.]
MLTPRAPRRARGVTLVEVLIGLLIVSILIAMAVPGFMGWIRNQRIRAAAESILNGLQTARAEALRANTIVEIQIGNGWTITRSCTPEEVEEDADCAAVEIQSGGWSQGSLVAIAPSSSSFCFNGMGRRRVTADCDSHESVSVSSADGSACVKDGGEARCLRIDVNSSDGIRMCDPALTTINPNDPQACP